MDQGLKGRRPQTNLRGESQMEKKSKAAIGKMIDAKAKGKRTRKVTETDDSKPESAEVDTRISKATVKLTG
ncbi:MAG: hypothetical protein NVS9B1_23120 [Candidatus Dormibacteraceae bacterium]